MFIEAIHLIIRDKVDPVAVHNALLELDEYRDGLSSDMPGFIDVGGQPEPKDFS